MQRVEGGLWSIELFGGLRVSGADTTVNRFPTRRSALLLARLALSRTGSMSRDDLAETLWPDDFLDSTRLRLRQELNRLRDALGAASEIIVSDRSWIRLDLEKVTIDAREFDRLLKQDTDSDRVRALDFYHGPLLPEQSEDWVQAQRQEFQARYLAALVRQVDTLIEAGKEKDAVAFALRAIRSDPYHEPARMAAMRTLVQVGDVAGAIRLYTEFEKALAKEFGTRPSEAMLSLLTQIRSASKSQQSAEAVEVLDNKEIEPSAPMPIYLDRIIGRNDELGLLETWLTSSPPSRLITITGPGGVGKTRLAITCATALAKRFGDNAFFIGLADIESGYGALAKIQKAFNPGAPTYSEVPLPSWGDKPAILVLDNAEHLIDEARNVAQQIVLNHPNVILIVTSRQRLGLGGEQELPLSPLAGVSVDGDREALDRSPAAQLFLQRARSVRPGYAVGDEQIEQLGMLIERLDGLPLSLELAAARVGALSLSQMLNEIDDRFTFLVSRRADVEDRQKSLRATIEWSFSKLDDSLKEVIRELAVFRSGWTLDLAKQATQLPNVHEVLQDLMDRSLIFSDETETGVRFGMLEAIRDYLLAEVSPQQFAKLREVHCNVVAGFLYEYSRRLIHEDQDRAYRVLHAEMDNARAAMEHAVTQRLFSAGKLGASYWRVWCARGKPLEGAEILDRLLAELPENPDADWAEACGGRGVIAFLVSDDAACAYWFDRSAKVYEKLGRMHSVSWAVFNMSRSHFRQGRSIEAEKGFAFALKHASERNVAEMGLTLAQSWTRVGKPEQAMAFAEESFAAQLGDSDVAGVASSYCQLADIYTACGRFDGVHGLLLESLERLRKAPVQDYQMMSLLSLSREELRQGHLVECRDAAKDAMRIAQDIRDHISLATVENLLAQAASREGDLETALARHVKALRIALPKGAGVATIETAQMLAHDLAAMGNLEAALKVLSLERGLREAIGCGLTLTEQAALNQTIERLGEEPKATPIESAQQLAAKTLAILKGIGVPATV